MRWRRYCNELLDIAAGLGVDTVVTVGALLADVPHTRPIPVNATSEDADVRDLFGLEPNTLRGPDRDRRRAAARGRRPRDAGDVAVGGRARTTSRTRRRPRRRSRSCTGIEQLLGEPVPLGELPDDSAAWQHGVDELAAEDSEIGEYVHQLEEAKDTADLPEASGEAIAQEFERYLRRRDKGTGG